MLLALFAIVSVNVWANEVTDVLNQSVTKITTTNYAEFINLTATSDAVYAGNIAGANASIQLRSKNNSGIITTTSGGTAKKIVVTWNENTDPARVLDIYGSETAYSVAADLYNADTQGTKIGSLAIADATDGVSTLEIEDEYAYIGIRSNSGAMYLTSIAITWETGAAAPSVAKPVITPNGGYFIDTQEVTFSCETQGAEIYYTIDGSEPANGNEPSTSATKYERTLLVTENNTVVRAVAFKDGAKSKEATATFTQIQSYSKLAAMSGLATNTPFVFTGPLMVTAKPTDKYVYVYDGTSFGLIYDGTGTKTAAAEKGKYITAGWTGTVSIYNKLFELVPDQAITVNADPAQPFNYLEEPISEANIHKVITLKNVTSFSANGKNLSIIIDNEKDIQEACGAKGYNQFGIEIPEAEEGKTYEIIGAIGRYNDNLQFWPITIQEPGEPQPEPVIGFYVAGSMNNWSVNENYKMTMNEKLVEQGIKEFSLTTTLKAGNEFKVVSSNDGSKITSWFPGDGKGNYTIDADGEYTIYCRPNFDGDDSWYEKCLKVEAVKEPAPEPALLKNGDFSKAAIIDNHICTYSKDMENNGTTFCNMQDVADWTIVNNGDARAAGVMAYGSETWIGGTGYAVPAVNPAGKAEGQALGIVAVWGADAQYTQAYLFEPGYYLVSARINNVGGTTATAANLFGATIGETSYYADNKTYEVGVWTRENVTFQVEAAADGVISLGYKATNAGNASQQHLFYDGVFMKVFETAEARNAYIKELADADAADAAANNLIVARKNALAALETLSVGEGLFQYSQEAINAAKIAIQAAETADAIKAAMPQPTAPDASKAYAITNATAEGNLSIATEKVTVAKDAAIYFTAVEGGFVLSNDEGEYVFKTTGNTWTLSTTTNIEEAYVVTVVPVEGGFTIKGANGLFGLDNTAEGSTVYANKSQNNNGLWTIAEWVAPVEPAEDYTAFIVNADLKSTEPAGFDATGTKGIDGSGIVKCANNAVYDFKQTITGLPAGKYTVSVQAAYRYGADEQAEADAYFNDAIETKFAKLYATVGTKTVDVLVKNRYDGASDTDWANGEGSVMVMGKPVPNSSAAVQAWFDAKQYTNEVTFNLVEAGDVTIGIVKTAQPEAGDYTVIGPWTLTRIGDADEEEPEPQPQPGLIADGKYYFFNVATEQYLAAGADWGTHAVVNADGVEYTVALADGKYTIDSQISNGGNNHYLNGEWNDGAAMGWTIAEVREGVYTLSNGEKFLTAQDNGVVTLQDDATAMTAMWTLVTPEARLSELANATADAPVNATFLITDANFGRNDLRQSAWTIDAANKNLSGGNNTNNCAESFHSVFTLSQTLANAPKGVYALTAQGFYRQDGSDDENLPVFFANDETAKFPLKTGSENSMSDASNSFTDGAYTIDPIYVKISDGETLTIGAKLEGNTNLWCIWDNFQLTYFGAEANIDDLRFAGLIAQLAELKDEATRFINLEEVSASTLSALQTAVRGADTVESNEEAYNTAIAALKDAIAQAKKDVVNKAAIDAMYALIESTNVYTAEALETYKRAADDYKAAFEEGTLTVTVDNPAALHGWRTNNDYDDLLLSAWTIDGVQASDFTTDLYINNWSTEGVNDGSEFFVPFFEYWTGDGNSLAERTLAANMTNLPAGNYTISAWVRVRAKNGYTAPAYGITLSGNDGEAVDVAAGNQIGTSQFYINEYTANCVVGADGKLTIQFNIAADNNISWLSFKNVKFEKVSEVGVNGIAIDASNDAIYDLTGRRVKTPVKGSLYIINGNKKLVK